MEFYRVSDGYDRLFAHNIFILMKCLFLFAGRKIGRGSWVKTKICIVFGAEMATNSKRNQMTAVFVTCNFHPQN